ncbi:uncharacterized protein PAE49_003684 [Odontesthes bonariensis]|uniref:uncharacterized protein LOC142379122 n=1 Tax=Odontesthes bonariensis TaxID=219752 RepID=UPI003F582105
MSSRLAFQTQLASIMEVLANAAVAEICKLVDDDYAVVSLQMSQCQRENKALKRKLHLLELKMARGYAERRLRESATNSGRPRVHVSGGDRLQESSCSTDGVFEQQVEVTLWSGRAVVEEAAPQPTHSERIQTKSPDVQLVKPDVPLVKEEKMETNMPQVEEMEPLRDDGEMECVSRGAAGQRLSLEDQDTHIPSAGSHSQIQSRTIKATLTSSRGVEKDEGPDVVLVKVEDVEPVTGGLNQTCLSIQEGLVESSTDDCRGMRPPNETPQTSKNQLSDQQDSGRGFSESAAPQLISRISEDSSSVLAVQLKVPDINTPAKSTMLNNKTNSMSSLSSECSLFELETFFNRWAPDKDSLLASGDPSCCFTNDDSMVDDQDEVSVVEIKSHPWNTFVPSHASDSSATTLSGGYRLSSAASSSVGTSESTPLRMLPPCKRPAVMATNARAQLQQRHGSKLSQLSFSTAAVSNRSGGDNIGVSGISSTSRTISCTVAQQSSLSVNGSTAALADAEVASTAQHQPSTIACHRESSTASTGPWERRRKSYVCRACGKAFSGLSNLEAHERVHTGEKPFACNTCGKRFSEAGNLKKHQRVHTGEKPFSCDQCGKKFAWICNLRTHQQSTMVCRPQTRGALGMCRSHTQ